MMFHGCCLSQHVSHLVAIVACSRAEDATRRLFLEADGIDCRSRDRLLVAHCVCSSSRTYSFQFRYVL